MGAGSAVSSPVDSESGSQPLKGFLAFQMTHEIVLLVPDIERLVNCSFSNTNRDILEKVSTLRVSLEYEYLQQYVRNPSSDTRS